MNMKFYLLKTKMRCMFQYSLGPIVVRSFCVDCFSSGLQPSAVSVCQKWNPECCFDFGARGDFPYCKNEPLRLVLRSRS